MPSSRVPLVIIGVVAVLIAAAATIYIVNQDSAAPAVDAGQNAGEQESEEADAAETDSVEIVNNTYSPATITVKVGTEVTWTNQDSVAHTVTTYDGAPATVDSGLFGRGESFSFTFDEPGTYEYFCEPHPHMRGTVIVTE